MSEQEISYVIQNYQSANMSTQDASELIDWANVSTHKMEGELKSLTKILANMTEPKKFITTKELSDRYSISESQQKGLRGRVKYPIPFYQNGEGGKIKYEVSEIDDWMSQQKVKRGI